MLLWCFSSRFTKNKYGHCTHIMDTRIGTRMSEQRSSSSSTATTVLTNPLVQVLILIPCYILTMVLNPGPLFVLTILSMTVKWIKFFRANIRTLVNERAHQSLWKTRYSLEGNEMFDTRFYCIKI